MSLTFAHIALRIKNLDAMLEFYCHGLGLSEAFKIFNDDGSLRIVYLHISQHQYLELCLGGTTKPPFDDSHNLGFRHIAFTVQDLAEFKQQAESRGVVFDSEILNMRDHNLAVYLFDPESNKIEIVEIQKNSQHKRYEA